MLEEKQIHKYIVNNYTIFNKNYSNEWDILKAIYKYFILKYQFHNHSDGTLTESHVQVCFASSLVSSWARRVKNCVKVALTSSDKIEVSAEQK